MICDRDPATGKGLVIGMSEKGSTERAREIWEQICNEALRDLNHRAQIDRRSLVDQSITDHKSLGHPLPSQAPEADTAPPDCQGVEGELPAFTPQAPAPVVTNGPEACKVVMDRWQEMLVENKMGSLGFCEHFTGCGGRSDVQERDLFSPKRSVAGYCGPEWATARVLCQNP